MLKGIQNINFEKGQSRTQVLIKMSKFCWFLEIAEMQKSVVQFLKVQHTC